MTDKVENNESYFTYFSSYLMPSEFEMQGCLAHPNNDPLYQLDIKLYRKILFFHFPLCSGTTNEKGEFSLRYRIKRLPFLGQNLVMRVMEETLKSPNTSSQQSKIPVHTLYFPTRFKQKKTHFSDLKAPFYEYHKNLPLLDDPTAPLIKKIEKPPTRPAHPFIRNFIDTIGATLEKSLTSFLPIPTHPDEKIQEILDQREVEKTLDHSENSTLEMIFNGIYPCDPLKTSTPGLYKVDLSFQGYDKKLVPILPDAQLFFTLENEKPAIQKLILTYPQKAPMSFTRGDKDFLRALYHFNCTALYKGQLAKLLAVGQVATEQYAMAVFRHLTDHPIAKLLKPHLREVISTNRQGHASIFSSNTLIAQGPLTLEGIQQHLKDSLKEIDYHGFQPREALFPEHRFALAGQRYWEIVKKSVDLFFNEMNLSADNPQTQKQWYQIYYLSKALVENSVSRSSKDDKLFEQLLDKNEAFKPHLPGRKRLEEGTKTLTPITQSLDKPTAEDIQRLKAFCIHAIYQATFFRWWVFCNQNIWGAQLHLASLSPQAFAPLPYGNTDVPAARQQINIAKTLTDKEQGALIRNPNGDIYPALITELRRNKDYLLALGLNINELPYGAIV